MTFVRDKQGGVTGYVYHYADGQQVTGKKIKCQGKSHENQLETPRTHLHSCGDRWVF
jgi:hypothetical protein